MLQISYKQIDVNFDARFNNIKVQQLFLTILAIAK